MSQSSLILKILGGLAVLIVTVVGALAPFFLQQRYASSRRYAHIIHLSNHLSIGVFLGAALLHLLPDSIRMFADLLQDSSSPFVDIFPFLILGVGMVLADFIASLTSAAAPKDLVLAAAALATNDTKSHRTNSEADFSVFSSERGCESSLNATEIHRHGSEERQGTVCVIRGEKLDRSRRHAENTEYSPLVESNDGHQNMQSLFFAERRHRERVSVVLDSQRKISCFRSPTNSEIASVDNEDQGIDADEEVLALEHRHIAIKSHGGLPYIIAVLLGFHSLVAGMALGAAAEKSDAIAILVAILSHKWAESFALSLTLVKQHITLRESLGIVSVYSLMCPLGISVAVVLTEFVISGTPVLAVEAAFSAFASGTFLYVAVVHMAEKDMDYRQTLMPLWRILSQGTGFALMLLVSILE